MIEAPAFVYRFYDRDDQLLYVGLAAIPPARWRQHRGKKAWWPAVARIQAAQFANREAAAAAEVEAIQTERPLHNVQHNSGGASGVMSIRREIGIAEWERRRADASHITLGTFAAAVHAVGALVDRAEQAKALGHILAAIPDIQAALRAERQASVRALHDDDKLSWAQIGEKLGVARTRAAQIGSGVTGGVKKKPVAADQAE